MYTCWEWRCLRVLRAWGRLGLIRLPPYGSRHLHDRTLPHPRTVLQASHGKKSGGILSLVEIIFRSGLRSDCESFHKLPGPSRYPGFGKTCVSLGCVRPLQGGPIGCSSPRAPLERSSRVWPWGSLDTRPRGLSHATPLGGCYVSGHDPSPAHAGGRFTPDRWLPPPRAGCGRTFSDSSASSTRSGASFGQNYQCASETAPSLSLRL